jgi:hypothetical protein
MVERELQHETIGRGELFILSHPGTTNTFSGYGLTTEPGRKDLLVGLLMVDRPHPADPVWLQSVTKTFGECELLPMTATGERGLLCRMQIEADSTNHIRRFPSGMGVVLREALEELSEEPPAPVLRMRWDEGTRTWLSEFAASNELPPKIREVFERTGYGCLAAEADIGIVHVCHASDQDIDGFRDKPIHYQWQLIKMPTAPLIRLDVVLLDNPTNPFKFESFLNIDAKDQAAVLTRLANQDRLFLAFYGTDLSYRYTKVINHDEQQWQYLDELIQEAERYLYSLESGGRDFDLAKAEFMQHFI